MFAGDLQLALVPFPPLLAAMVVFGMPPARARPARLIGAAAALASAALLAAETLFVAGGGRIEATLGTPVTGIAFLLRLDLQGLVLALAAALAVVLLLADARCGTREAAAMLVCLTGTIVAALAGNVVMLFAGVEIANAGTVLVLGASRRRPGRAAVLAAGIQHAASLGLLAATAQLQVSVGTTNFSVIPAGALTASAAVPWGLAGAVRLLSPAFVPARGVRAPTAAWAASGALPCGAIVLLRLREASAGESLGLVATALAILAVVVALLAARAAARRGSTPLTTGRALMVIAAAPVVALAGVSGSRAGAAVAAGICAVMLCATMSPAWERVASRRGGSALGAFALVAAGGLPLGFGTTAVVLELSAALGPDRGNALMALGLAVAALVGAGASVKAAVALWQQGTRTARGAGIAPLAVVATIASGVAAVAPGTVATVVLTALAGGGGAAALGPVAIRSAAGDWAGGYLLAALLLVLLLGWSLAILLGIGVRRPSDPGPACNARPASIGLARARRLRPAMRQGGAAVDRLDAWLLVQPQLSLVVAGAFLANVLVH